MDKEQSGVLWVVFAYIMWGFMPIYWKSLSHVSSGEILVSRIVWAFVLTSLLIVLMRNGQLLKKDLKDLWKTRRDFWALFAASLIISVNWFVYIWAVNHSFVVEASLGYYINPLISVILGIFFLKEKLSKAQKSAFLLATIGVLILTISYGKFPWLSFTLAISFAVYGLLKKRIKIDALRGMAIETLFIAPFAFSYLVWLFISNEAVFLHAGIKTDILLILTGAATATPLVFFAKGVQRMPLYLSGFLQYIAPSLMLFLGVIIYKESFGKTDLLSFSFIWTALVLFTVSKVVETVRNKKNRP